MYKCRAASLQFHQLVMWQDHKARLALNGPYTTKLQESKAKKLAKKTGSPGLPTQTAQFPCPREACPASADYEPERAPREPRRGSYSL
jgi:hypothetical protein